MSMINYAWMYTFPIFTLFGDAKKTLRLLQYARKFPTLISDTTESTKINKIVYNQKLDDYDNSFCGTTTTICQ